MEALEKIPEVFVIRSKIALLTAEYANRLHAEGASKFCYKLFKFGFTPISALKRFSN